jgi:hypothetical protein
MNMRRISLVPAPIPQSLAARHQLTQPLGIDGPLDVVESKTAGAHFGCTSTLECTLQLEWRLPLVSRRASAVAPWPHPKAVNQRPPESLSAPGVGYEYMAELELCPPSGGLV